MPKFVVAVRRTVAELAWTMAGVALDYNCSGARLAAIMTSGDVRVLLLFVCL